MCSILIGLAMLLKLQEGKAGVARCLPPCFKAMLMPGTAAALSKNLKGHGEVSSLNA